MAIRLNLEMIVTNEVLLAVKGYDINIPEVCINALVKEIERHHEISNAISTTTASKDTEIQELKKALRVMREKLEKAEAAAHVPWHLKMIRHK